MLQNTAEVITKVIQCLDCSAKEIFHGCILKIKTFILKLINTGYLS